MVVLSAEPLAHRAANACSFRRAAIIGTTTIVRTKRVRGLAAEQHNSRRKAGARTGRGKLAFMRGARAYRSGLFPDSVEVPIAVELLAND